MARDAASADIAELLKIQPPNVHSRNEAYSLGTYGKKYGWKDHKSPSRRYFVLYPNEIAYFASEKDVSAGKSGKESKAKGSIPLELFGTCFKVNADEPVAVDTFQNAASARSIRTPQIGIRVRVPSVKRTFYIFLESVQEREAWFVAVQFNLEWLRFQTKDFVDRALDQYVSDPSVSAKEAKIAKVKLRYRFRIRPDETDPRAAYIAQKKLLLGEYDHFRAMVVSVQDLDADMYLAGGSTFLFDIVSTTTQSHDVVQWFLEHFHVSVNQPHLTTKDTPLLKAVQLGNVDTVRVLLDYGADRALTNIYGESAASESLGDELLRNLLRQYTPAVKPSGSLSSRPKKEAAPVDNAKQPAISPARPANVIDRVPHRLVSEQDLISRIDHIVDFFIDSCEDKMARDGFRDASAIQLLTSICYRSKSVDSKVISVVMSHLARIVDVAPLDFLSSEAVHEPLSKTLFHLISSTSFRASFPADLSQLLSSFATRLYKDQSLLVVLMASDHRSPNAFPLFTGLVRLFNQPNIFFSTTYFERLTSSFERILALPQRMVSEFVVHETQFSEITVSHLESFLQRLTAQKFVNVTKEDDAFRTAFFNYLRFLDKLFFRGHNLLLLQLREAVVQCLMTAFSFLRDIVRNNALDAESVHLLEHSIRFLCEIAICIESNPFLELFAEVLFGSRNDQENCVFFCLSSGPEPLCLAALDLLHVFVDRASDVVLDLLIGRFFVDVPFLVGGTSQADLFSIANTAAWESAFPCVFDEPDGLGQYEIDTRLKVIEYCKALSVIQTQSVDRGRMTSRHRASLHRSSFAVPSADLCFFKMSDKVSTGKMCPLLAHLFGRLQSFVVNTPVINIRLTGIISQLAMIPYPPLVGFLLACKLKLSDEWKSLYSIISGLTKHFQSDSRFSEARTKLPLMFGALGIDSRHTADPTSPQSSYDTLIDDVPESASLNPEDALYQKSFFVQLSILLEFRRELLSVLNSWHEIDIWQTQLNAMSTKYQ
eukprot:ANDGO_06300.mRNA.1 hypothetical protein